ncbi:hypothetical protein FACS1894195_2350 [Bacteroidia bacterium]|nr:hypothetical protein FACS1894195_2350 [Bacteroidia bacterium]
MLQIELYDRLSGRWNRFSWFGFYSVNDTGNLQTDIKTSFSVSTKDIGDLLEAILIESVEPRQNRKRGNSFDSIEFLQYEDPELTKKKMIAMVQKF